MLAANRPGGGQHGRKGSIRAGLTVAAPRCHPARRRPPGPGTPGRCRPRLGAPGLAIGRCRRLVPGRRDDRPAGRCDLHGAPGHRGSGRDRRGVGAGVRVREGVRRRRQGHRITLRELARMQSGLFNYSEDEDFQRALVTDPYRPFTPQELLGYAFAHPLDFPPGQGFHYSNTNTTLLGLVIEQVSGLPLHEFLEQRVFQPRELEDTSFPTDNAFPQPHAQGYTQQTLDGSETVATDWNPSWGWAAGAVISTLDDMRTWARALATGTLLEPGTQAQRLETVTPPGFNPAAGYGLGLFDVDGWIGHNGSLPGYQTLVVYLPQDDLTLVVLLNTDESVPGSGEPPSSAFGTAITQVISPDHVFDLTA